MSGIGGKVNKASGRDWQNWDASGRDWQNWDASVQLSGDVLEKMTHLSIVRGWPQIFSFLYMFWL